MGNGCDIEFQNVEMSVDWNVYKVWIDDRNAFIDN